MEEFKAVLEGIYKLMTEVQVPVFGYEFSLWVIFLFGLLGGLVVWFLLKFIL